MTVNIPVKEGLVLLGVSARCAAEKSDLSYWDPYQDGILFNHRYQIMRSIVLATSRYWGRCSRCGSHNKKQKYSTGAYYAYVGTHTCIDCPGLPISGTKTTLLIFLPPCLEYLCTSEPWSGGKSWTVNLSPI